MEQDKLIYSVVDNIVDYCEPAKIILVSNKFNTKHELTSFKLCVIVNDVQSPAELEGELYMHTDSDIPYDIIIYNLSEWDELIEDYGTFASKVNQTGVVLYG